MWDVLQEASALVRRKDFAPKPIIAFPALKATAMMIE